MIHFASSTISNSNLFRLSNPVRKPQSGPWCTGALLEEDDFLAKEVCAKSIIRMSTWGKEESPHLRLPAGVEDPGIERSLESFTFTLSLLLTLIWDTVDDNSSSSYSSASANCKGWLLMALVCPLRLTGLQGSKSDVSSAEVCSWKRLLIHEHSSLLLLLYSNQLSVGLDRVIVGMLGGESRNTVSSEMGKKLFLAPRAAASPKPVTTFLFIYGLLLHWIYFF